MNTYHGSCHCGRVEFEIQSDLNEAVACNCSICTKKGALLHLVPPDRFKLLHGDQDLGRYQFGTKTAKHWFCQHCGIHPFGNPRTAPTMYAINICCLDEFQSVASQITIREFDGQHWEEAFRNLRR